MSDIATKLNVLVIVIVGVAGAYFLTTKHDPGPPQDDRWFQSTVVDRMEPVVVKFGADWCGPCQMLDPELDQLERSMGGLVSVVRVDVDKHRDLAQHYGVSSIPRILLLRNGHVVGDRVGYADHQQLQKWVVAEAQN
jgi:thioredoxin